MSTFKPVTILHLSDLQFDRNFRFGRLALPPPENTLDRLLVRLQDDLESMHKKHDVIPDLVVLTGDLAEWGRRTEFEQMFEFVDRLTVLLGIGRERVVLVPGNHDVNRDLNEAYFKQCRGLEEEPKPPWWPKWQPYAGFFQRFYEGMKEVTFTEEAPWTLFEIPALRLVVAGLNSTMRESHRDEDHYGWVGEAQLRWFAGRLRPYQEKGWMRIAVLHHNVQRRAQNDDENLRDADDLKRILAPWLNLVLHGHTHNGALEWLVPNVPVLSTGSAGVAATARPEEVPNQYQVIKLYPDRLWFGVRAYRPDQRRWIGDTAASPDGNTWFHEAPVSFDQVGATFATLSGPVQLNAERLAGVVDSYRRFLVKRDRLDALLDMAARAEDRDIPRGLDLLQIFVPQSVRRLPPRPEIRRAGQHQDLDAPPALETPEPIPPEGLSCDAEEPDTADPGHFIGGRPPWIESPGDSVLELFTPGRPTWTLLLGAPGAGKTAFTRWVCLKLCTPGDSLPGLPVDLVPVRIEMRRFDERYRAATRAGRSYDFFDFIDQEHAELTIALRGDLLRELATEGRIFWLFDGMDEVPDVIMRAHFADMIAGLAASGPSSGLITSRLAGVERAQTRLETAGIPSYQLQDFTDEQIEIFVTRRHLEAFPGHPERGSQRCTRLERTLRESRAVRELCRNPLLLTLVCLLNRGGELPRRRHLLYRDAVRLMVDQWEANKHLEVSALLEPEDRIRFLRELAWHMMSEVPEGSGNRIDRETLLQFTSQFLGRLPGISSDRAQFDAEALLRNLQERNYVLTFLGGDLYGFVHKTFLEYLAADAIRSLFAGRQRDLAWVQDLFREHWTDDDWEEVLPMICGLLEEDHPENVLRLVQAVVPQAALAQSAAANLDAFIVRCLAEVRQLDQEPLQEAALRLMALIQHDVDSYRIGIFFGRFKRLTEPLFSSMLVFGDNWPEPEEWVKWAERRAGHNPEVAMALVLCTQPVEQRVSVLLRFLGTETDPQSARRLVEMAQRMGKWTDPEVESLLDWTGYGSQAVRLAVASGLLSEQGSSRPLRILLEAYDDGQPDTAEEALRLLAGLGGQYADIIERLTEHARGHSDEGFKLKTYQAILSRSLWTDDVPASVFDAIFDLLVNSRCPDIQNEALLLLYNHRTKSTVSPLLQRFQEAGPISIRDLLESLPHKPPVIPSRVEPESHYRPHTFEEMHLYHAQILYFEQDDASDLWELALTASDPAVRVSAIGSFDLETYPLLVDLIASNPPDEVRARAEVLLERIRLRVRFMRAGMPARRRGIVRLDGQRVGMIEETERGSRFTYDRVWVKRPDALAISPTLPLREEPYDADGLHPFFDNLLPEGWLLEQACREFNLPVADHFGLMLAVCEDCIGAVEVLPADEDIP